MYLRGSNCSLGYYKCASWILCLTYSTNYRDINRNRTMVGRYQMGKTFIAALLLALISCVPTWCFSLSRAANGDIITGEELFDSSERDIKENEDYSEFLRHDREKRYATNYMECNIEFHTLLNGKQYLYPYYGQLKLSTQKKPWRCYSVLGHLNYVFVKDARIRGKYVTLFARGSKIVPKLVSRWALQNILKGTKTKYVFKHTYSPQLSKNVLKLYGSDKYVRLEHPPSSKPAFVLRQKPYATAINLVRDARK